jgi:hypothetical protein
VVDPHPVQGLARIAGLLLGGRLGSRLKGKDCAMRAVKEHFAQHPFHMLGCGVAGVLVVAAIVFSVPVLAALGTLMCGAMMVGMVWMMFLMASKGHR